MKKYAPVFVIVLFALAVGVSPAAAIKGKVASVSGTEVTIKLEPGAVPSVGDTVTLMDDVPELGLVSVAGTWKVTKVEGDVVTAATEDADAGTPQPGYLASIESASTETSAAPPEGAEQAGAATEGQTSEPMSDRPVLPAMRPGWPLYALIGLGAAIVLLLVAILALRGRRKPTASLELRLDIAYSDGGKKSLLLKKSRVLIGRGKGNDVALHDAGVSARHAEIAIAQGRLVLRDLRSSNGTFVNGQRISEHTLHKGDRIMVGATTITVG